MIEPTDEMKGAVLRWRSNKGALAVDIVTDLLAIVERDYDVRRRAPQCPPRRGALHPHLCVSCSDGTEAGPGCINCRQTGFDQSPWPDCEQCRFARRVSSA